jgi:uncharacterized protein (TIGR03437 family)
MNTVRVAIDPDEYMRAEDYRARFDRLLHMANDLELLLIADALPSGSQELFWERIAERLRDQPNVFFAPINLEFARAIRRVGAKQPLILADPTDDPNVVYQFNPRYTDSREIWDRMSMAARRAPALADGLDPEFEVAGGECAAFPADPGEATRLLEAKLEWFDQQAISWTISSFTVGHLITDYWRFNGTKLDDGWTCGRPNEIRVGISMVVAAHLWRTDPLALFPVSSSRGGMVLARGGVASVYGPILADQSIEAREPLPVELGNVSVRITDSRGVARLAPLLYAGAGWSVANFIVPEECAAGPAKLAIVRKDGSTSAAHVLIGDIAPAILTASTDGRGAPIATATQTADGAEPVSFNAWTCEKGCRGLPIAAQPGISTELRLLGSGFRFARDKQHARAIAGGIEMPVISMGRASAPGNDQITVRVPDALADKGDVEFYFRVDGELSNVVRLRFEREARR